MGNSMSCAGKYNGQDFGAPRADGKDGLGRQALDQQLISTRLIESALGVCAVNSDVSSKNSKQREEVDCMIVQMTSSTASTADSDHAVSICQSTASAFGERNSQLRYMEPDQTIIIFDWDDTLCPSTFMRRHNSSTRGKGMKAPIEEQTQQELEKLVDQVIPLLRAAQAMGKVVLVTNARRPWVDTSCARFIPRLQEYLKGIDIIYAMEYLNDAEATRALTTNTLITSKARAMRAAVGEFYSRYANQSWKNLVSVGDALYEHEAIRQVAEERPGGLIGGPAKKCRTKTIKLIESPTVSGLALELSLVENWLAKVVLYDGDVDMDLAANESQLNKWIEQFGNSGLMA
eukprot:TRINITY_DN7478_c0_g1_i1.p1 TRINITY_DN7478_c0_g1~~TRINITY_DN7478_c0_g1_i1.p1  ORF type:complete len:346 (+),score=87.38 TRINITY_DN7478_c0_g1_i1:79-1116(+)